jgi:hypothetical protein
MRLVRQTPSWTATLLRQYPFRLSSSSDGFGEDEEGQELLADADSKIKRAARLTWAAACECECVCVCCEVYGVGDG